MHTRAFNKNQKNRLREISKSDTNVGLAVAHLSKKSSSKEDKIKRVWAKDICTLALK